MHRNNRVVRREETCSMISIHLTLPPVRSVLQDLQSAWFLPALNILPDLRRTVGFTRDDQLAIAQVYADDVGVPALLAAAFDRARMQESYWQPT